MTIQCSKCHYTANNKDNMLSHILYKHTDPKPWACAQAACNKTFPRRDELKKHVLDDHKRQQLLPSELQRDDMIYNRAKHEAANCATVQNNNSAAVAAAASSAAPALAPTQITSQGLAPMQPSPQSFAQPSPSTFPSIPPWPAPFPSLPPGLMNTPYRGSAPGIFEARNIPYDTTGPHIPGSDPPRPRRDSDPDSDYYD